MDQDYRRRRVLSVLLTQMTTRRSISASQMPSGQIPQHAVFSGAAGGRDEAMQVPDRAATRAGLVLMLSVPPDEMIVLPVPDIVPEVQVEAPPNVTFPEPPNVPDDRFSVPALVVALTLAVPPELNTILARLALV